MDITNIAGMSFGLSIAVFALAGAVLERSITRNGVGAITRSHIGVRLLLASGAMLAASVFTTMGAALATA